MHSVLRKFLKNWDDTFDYWRVSRKKYFSKKLPEIESPRSNITSPSITLTDSRVSERACTYITYFMNIYRNYPSRDQRRAA